MKKTLLVMLAMCMLISIFTVPVSAAENETDRDIIMLDNGCYITVELNVLDSRAASVKTGNKAYVCRNSSGAELWRATLYGTFTYTGTSSNCASASCTVTITDDAWYTISNSYARSGNSAVADVVMGKKLFGIKIGEEAISVRLTCDVNGNLS